MFCLCLMISAQNKHSELEADSLQLTNVVVFGKSKAKQLSESPYSVTAIDISRIANSNASLSDIINRQAGIKIRTEGGMGSDYDMSINGLSGNAIQYFIDGVPLASLGKSVNLQNIPLSTIERVEIYKGVVPGELGGDALGGAVNIVTRKERKDYLDVSASGGSFHTWKAQLNARYIIPHTNLSIKPTFSYDYSRNDYKMKDVRVWDEQSEEYINTERRRFHDRYENIMGQLELSLDNQKWADQLSLQASFVHTTKQLQTGSVQTIVYGDAHRKANSWNIQARYRKRDFLIKHLSASILLSHTIDNSVTIDTAYRKYNWSGEYINTARNEISGRARMMRHYSRPLTVLRTNFNYDIADWHSVNLNYILTRTGNRRTDDLNLDTDFVPSNDVSAKHIISLSYSQNLMDDRMQNTAFVKDYINHTNIEQQDMAWKTNGKGLAPRQTTNDIGGGVGTRFRFWQPLQVKASYERAIRLPLARELLGNGYSVYPNLALQPEKSHNVNAGLFGDAHFGGSDHTLSYEVTGFLRKVTDYIRLVVSESEGTYQYENVNNVTVAGVEAQLSYKYSKYLNFTTNATYERSKDKTRINKNGKPSLTYDNDIPNKPWLFANAMVDLTLPHIAERTDKLQLSYQFQYTHWYYLTWENFGAKANKGTIPNQFNHNISLTYSWDNDRYNVSIECDNLLDATLYDNYKLQKPGRSIMAGVRVFLK